MSNSYFQFKKFRIEQDKTAMKVCTDSCILGAYTNPGNAKRILDIGTGTGLLALMLAQKSEAKIDAIEIEVNAYEQAKENFLKSQWNNRLHIFHERIQNFSSKKNEKYDLIISNPPFFSNQLKSPSKEKNIALHGDELTLKELTYAVSQLLDINGEFIVLLPAYEFQLLKDEALKFQLHLNKILNIRDRENLPILRVIATFSFLKKENTISELIIKNAEGNYSDEFIALLKEYYLHL